MNPNIDCVYIAASAHDSRYTRICVASVRRFYPSIPIRILAGGVLQRGLIDELQKYWDVELASAPPADYGWGFVKLEPLFGPPGERFLVLDSDTVLTGPVLDLWTPGDAPFLVDDEIQSEVDLRRLYYEWDKVREIDAASIEPRFVFNTGQWFGTAGILARSDFSPWLQWSLPRQLNYPDRFKNGEQGLLNYIFNQKAAYDGFPVQRRKIMRWPGHSMDGLDATAVGRGTADALVVHWAGMKKMRLRDMVGADLLAFFEREYYRRLPFGAGRRVLAGWRSVGSAALDRLRVGARLKALRKLAKIVRPHASETVSE